MNLLTNGFFSDQKGRNISLDNVIIVVEGLETKNGIGFNSNVSNGESIFDESIINDNNSHIYLNEQYKSALSRMNYEISFEFDIDNKNKKMVNEYLFNFTKNKPYGKYKIKKEDIF